MAYLVRCPFYSCKRPKRVDKERAPNGAFAKCECPGCSLIFYAVPPMDGRVGVNMENEWRPFEPSKEAVEAGRNYNRCNRHNDCQAAEDEFKKQYPKGKHVGYGVVIYSVQHCSDEGCEECFGC